MYFIEPEGTSVLATIAPSVGAEALYLAVFVLTSVAMVICTVWPFMSVDTVSIAFAISKVSAEGATVGPPLKANTFLDALKEFPMIAEVIHVRLNAYAMLKVSIPLAFVRFTLDQRVLAVTVGSTQIPLALIARAVLKVHLSLAMSKATEPLALISGS